MDLLNIAAQLFLNKSGQNLDLGSVVGALKGLLPSSGNDLDIGALVSMFSQNGGGLASMVGSWLGDGANDTLSADNLMSMFGQDKLDSFAQNLGMRTEDATSALAETVPELIDKSSEGGSLVQDIGGQLAKGLLGKLF